MEKIVFGTSVKGLDIEIFRLTDGPVKVLLMGGVHGDEPEGYTFVENFLRRADWKSFENKLALYAIPRMNPDGCLANTRLNSNGVDLNRNYPLYWGIPETFVLGETPSYENDDCNDPCGECYRGE